MVGRDLFRETTFGKIARQLTNGKVLLYPEEEPNFILPEQYSAKSKPSDYPPDENPPAQEKDEKEAAGETGGLTRRDTEVVVGDAPFHKEAAAVDNPSVMEKGRTNSTISRTATFSRRGTSNLQRRISFVDEIPPIPKRPTVVTDKGQDYILVDWYDDHGRLPA